MEVIGYTYNADHWCEDCLPVDPDNENVGVMFDYTECDYPMYCSKCHGLLGGVLTQEGERWLKETFLDGQIHWDNMQELMETYGIDWSFEWSFTGWIEVEE